MPRPAGPGDHDPLIHALNRSGNVRVHGRKRYRRKFVTCSGHSGGDLTEVLPGRVGGRERGGQVDDLVQALRLADMGLVIMPLCPLQA